MIQFWSVWNKIWKVLVFFIITACGTYESIEIQVLQPAKVKISPDIYKITLINNANYKKSSFVNIDNKEQYKINYDSVRTNECFNGLYSVLLNSPRYKIANIKPVYLVKPGYNERYKNIDWPTVNKLCADSDADAAIVLENYQVNYSNKIPLQYIEDQGYYRGTLEIENSTLWKIYIPALNRVEEDYLQKDTLYWDGYGVYEYQVIEQLPDLNDAIMQSCFDAGVKYGERIAQTWTNVNRYLVYCSNKNFKEAYILANQGKWDEAIELWKKFTYLKRKKLAAYAAYNIAVACETLDHIDIALEWAAKSYLIKQNKFVDNYIKLLEKRKVQQEIIEDQFR